MNRPQWIHRPVIAWIRMCRPLIVFVSMFGASAGALNVTVADIAVNHGAPFSVWSFLLMLLGAGLLSAGLMIHNDVTDYASDVVNRPHKPLPAGVIAMGTARVTGLATMVLSVVAAALTTVPLGLGLNIGCAAFTATIVVIGVLYNKWGKFWGLWGHIFVAYGVGAIPFWGAWALRPDRPWLMFPLALAIFVMEIGREIMVCAGDLAGDIAANFRTTPVRIGRLPSMRLALAFYLLSAPLFPAPSLGWFGAPVIFGSAYLKGALLFVAVLLVTWALTYRAALRGDDQQIWRSFELYIRTGTRLGVVAFQLLIFADAFI